MPHFKKGYLPPAVILFLAGLSLFVAAIIVFNTQLVENIKKGSLAAPTALPTIPAISNETPNWKTYTNSNYGYSIKFPSDFIKSYENSTSILLDGRIGTYEQGSKILNGITLDLTISKYKDVKSVINAYKQNITLAKNVTIGPGIPATQIDIKNPSLQEDLYTYVQLPKQMVLVIRISWTEKNGPYYSKLANQMLSTFKFTN